ncbi:MAG: hypothetical protein IPH00_17940 [Flavobacteriales bacterium]|nr:hypothetical protein [Flavobacteriales bacterium]
MGDRERLEALDAEYAYDMDLDYVEKWILRVDKRMRGNHPPYSGYDHNADEYLLETLMQLRRELKKGMSN